MAFTLLLVFAARLDLVFQLVLDRLHWLASLCGTVAIGGIG